MKGLIALIIVLAFVVGIPVYAVANGPSTNPSEFCKDLSDFGLRHGTCVNILENLFNRGNSTPVGICKFWELVASQDFYENYDNLGLCVADLRTADGG